MQVVIWYVGRFCAGKANFAVGGGYPMQGDTLTVTKPQVCYVYTDTAGGHRDTYGMLAGCVLAKQILL